MLSLLLRLWLSVPPFARRLRGCKLLYRFIQLFSASVRSVSAEARDAGCCVDCSSLVVFASASVALFPWTQETPEVFVAQVLLSRQRGAVE